MQLLSVIDQNDSALAGGSWDCVHIDDPRSPKIRMPSLSECVKLKPSAMVQQEITFLDAQQDGRGEVSLNNFSLILDPLLKNGV